MKIMGIVILLVFYAIYIGKMILQKKKGIQTDQIAKRKRKDKVFYTELFLKIATYLVVVVEVISILFFDSQKINWLYIIGIVFGVAGDVFFAMAVFTMKDSWRAGLAENDKTEMISDGIYKFSRNPAFLGFDCVYIGLLLMYVNIPLLLCSVFAMIMLHLQILQEETYLANVFGDEYLGYKSKVCRYLGMHSKNNTN